MKNIQDDIITFKNVQELVLAAEATTPLHKNAEEIQRLLNLEVTAYNIMELQKALRD